jgi:hypothetical protein
MSDRTDAGVPSGSACQSGSFLTIAATTSVGVSPSNGFVPVNISNSTHPNAHTSVRVSTAFPRLLVGQVRRRARNDAGKRRRGTQHGGRLGQIACERRLLERLRDPEIQYFRRAVRPQLDIRGLEIAVDDALVVRRFERLGHLLRDRERLVDRERALRDPIGERRAIDELDHESFRRGGILDPINRSDVRMIERREQLRFALEAGEPFGIIRKRVRKDLEGNVASELGVPRAIHLAHPAPRAE